MKKKTIVRNKVLKTTDKVAKRLTTNEADDILSNAIRTFGVKQQLFKFVEEMKELIDEIHISKGSLSERVIEEFVDVNILIAQFCNYIYFHDINAKLYYGEYFDKKMRRLDLIIQDERNYRANNSRKTKVSESTLGPKLVQKKKKR